jgi:hypothetical protein
MVGDHKEASLEKPARLEFANEKMAFRASMDNTKRRGDRGPLAEAPAHDKCADLAVH